MSSFLTHPDRHKTHANIAILAVLLLVAVVGWVTWSMVSDTSTPVASEDEDEVEDTIEEKKPDTETHAQPEGYVYFTQLDNAEDRRAIPFRYDFADHSYEEIHAADETYYLASYPLLSKTINITAPHVAREGDDIRAAYDTYPSISFGEEVFEPRVIMPGKLVVSDSSDGIAFHGLSRDFGENLPHGETFVGDSFLDIENWTIYYTHDDDYEELRELESGVNPVWNNDATALYYVGKQGVMRYDIQSGLSEQVTSYVTNDIFNTSGVRLKVSDEEDVLYKTFLSSTAEDDFIAIYELDDNEVFAEFKRQYELPAGTHTEMTLSPQSNFAGFVVQSENPSLTKFRIVDLTSEDLIYEDVFTFDTFGYFINPVPVWVDNQ